MIGKLTNIVGTIQYSSVDAMQLYIFIMEGNLFVVKQFKRSFMERFLYENGKCILDSLKPVLN